MITEVPIIGTVPSRARAARLPERIPGTARILLVIADAALMLFVGLLALNGAPNRLACAVVTAALICAVFWQCGLYRKSYAVHAHDEAYFACAGVALAAVPILLILAAVGQVPIASIVIALVLCALATSVARVRLHLERRRGLQLAAGI